MTKITMIIAAGLLAISAPAFAGGKSETKGNKAAAQAMSKTLAGAGSDGVLGFPGGSVARTLQGDSKGGWGNVGSGIGGDPVARPKR